jgi:hypothetical protein
MTRKPKYAIAPKGCKSYLTPGKRYELLPEGTRFFAGLTIAWPSGFGIKDDLGDILYCPASRRCIHAQGHWTFTDELEAEQPVDLTKCVPGQKLRRRDGEIVEYGKYDYSKDQLNHFTEVTGWHYDDGKWCGRSHDDAWDIIEVLPLEDNRPSGTCVAAGPAQFLDHQTCEPVDPHPKPLAKPSAKTLATYALIQEGWTPANAAALVGRIESMIKEARS